MKTFTAQEMLINEMGISVSSLLIAAVRMGRLCGQPPPPGGCLPAINHWGSLPNWPWSLGPLIPRLGYGKSMLNLRCFRRNILIQQMHIFPREVLEPQICWKQPSQCLEVPTAVTPPQHFQAPLFTKHLFFHSEKLFLWLTAEENSEEVYAEESEGQRVYLRLNYWRPWKGTSGVLKGMVSG